MFSVFSVFKRWFGVFAAALVAVSVLAGCSGGTQTTPSTVTVTNSGAPAVTSGSINTAPATSTLETSVTATAAGITIPDVNGENAKIAQEALEKLGLTNVELSSANPKYSMVLVAANWTVVSIDPAAGTAVKADDAVVVKVTKP
jgi:hypothetical protein